MKHSMYFRIAVLVVMLAFGIVANPALAGDHGRHRHRSQSIMPFMSPSPIMPMPFGISFGNRNFNMSLGAGSGYGGYGNYGFGNGYNYPYQTPAYGNGYNSYGYGGYGGYDPYYGQRVQYPGQPYMPPSIIIEEPSQPCFPDSPSVFINQGTRYVKRWTPGVGYYYVQLRRVQ